MQVPDRCKALEIAVHWTVLHSRADVLAVLLADKGVAEVDLVDGMKLAAAKSTQPVVELLLQHIRRSRTGAELTKAAGGGLFAASMYGQASVLQHILASHLEHGQEMDRLVFAAAIGGHHAVIQVLLEYGADATGLSPAVRAVAEEGHVRALEVLLDAGVPMERVSLLRVARGGHDGVLRLLIERGLQRTTRQKEEAMRAAAVAGYSSTAELLLGWGVHTRAAARRMAAVLQEAQRHQQGLQQ